MIKTRKQLNEILKEEKEFYIPKTTALEWIVTSDNRYILYKYAKR